MFCLIKIKKELILGKTPPGHDFFSPDSIVRRNGEIIGKRKHRALRELLQLGVDRLTVRGDSVGMPNCGAKLV